MKNKLEKWHSIKSLYNECNSIDDMLERVNDEIVRLEDMQELGAKVAEALQDDRTRLSATVEEGSEEEHNLCNMGFEVEVKE